MLHPYHQESILYGRFGLFCAEWLRLQPSEEDTFAAHFCIRQLHGDYEEIHDEFGKIRFTGEKVGGEEVIKSRSV